MVILHPLLVDLFIYSYEADFVHVFKKIWKKKRSSPTRLFHVLLYWCHFTELLNYFNISGNVGQIYSIELEIKDPTDTARSTSYHDLHIDINKEGIIQR